MLPSTAGSGIPSRASSEFARTAAKWGLSVNVQKTKALIMGGHLTPANTLPVQVSSGAIEVVSGFTYLGSNITSDGEVHSEVSLHIAKAARAFGCLQGAIFQNHHLSTEKKRKVYESVVLSVLLYGAASWTIKAGSLRRLNGFHNCCVTSIFGVSRHHQ